MLQSGEVTLQTAQLIYVRAPDTTNKNNLRWTGVVKDNIILDIEICAPMADFGRPRQFGNLKDRPIIRVMNGDTLLLLIQEVFGGGWWNIFVWAIRQRRTGFCYRVFQGEIAHFLRRSV